MAEAVTCLHFAHRLNNWQASEIFCFREPACVFGEEEKRENRTLRTRLESLDEGVKEGGVFSAGMGLERNRYIACAWFGRSSSGRQAEQGHSCGNSGAAAIFVVER